MCWHFYHEWILESIKVVPQITDLSFTTGQVFFVTEICILKVPEGGGYGEL
jgi:hypothetical protein